MVGSSPAIGLDGFIYVASTNGNLHKINAANGKVGNQFKTGGPITLSPAVSSGTIIYVGSDDKNIYAIETLTMKEIWSVATRGPVRSSPAIAPFSNTERALQYVIVGSVLPIWRGLRT